jgi:hypothetical protein
MSGYFDTYRKLLDIKGGSMQGSQKESLKQNILSNFYNSPSYYQVTINNSPTTSDVWITDDSETKELKRITTKPDADVLNVGDVVNWNGANWLTLIVDDMSGIYYRGTLELCNSTLTIQSPPTQVDTGLTDGMGRPIITETPSTSTNYPCIVKSNGYLRKQTDEQINLPEGRMLISIQYTTNPMIVENAEFTMYNRKYKIISCDYTNVMDNKGIITLTVDRL